MCTAKSRDSRASLALELRACAAWTQESWRNTRKTLGKMTLPTTSYWSATMQRDSRCPACRLSSPPPRRCRAVCCPVLHQCPLLIILDFWVIFQVVDAGLLAWKVGLAGEESPDPAFTAALDAIGEEANKRYAGLGARHGRIDSQCEKLIADHRAACWDHVLAVLRATKANPAWPATWPRNVLLMGVPLLESSVSSGTHGSWLLERIFGDLPSVERVAIMNQEVAALYTAGRTTGLMVQTVATGELSALAVYEGSMLTQTARVRQWDTMARVRGGVDKTTSWANEVAALVAEAVAAAPVAARKHLLAAIVLLGTGMPPGGEEKLQDRLRTMPGRSNPACTPMGRARVLPEHNLCYRDIIAWVGGSITGCLSAERGFNRLLPISREEYARCMQLPNGMVGRQLPYMCPAAAADRLAGARIKLAWAKTLCANWGDRRAMFAAIEPQLDSPASRLPPDLIACIARHLRPRRSRTGAALTPETAVAPTWWPQLTEHGRDCEVSNLDLMVRWPTKAGFPARSFARGELPRVLPPPHAPSGSDSSSEYSDEQQMAVVIDLGSGMIKAGFAGDDPRTEVRPVTGAYRYPTIFRDFDQPPNHWQLDSDDAALVAVCTVRHTISRGVVTDWAGMEKLFHHLFYSELRVEPNEHPCCVIEPVLNPRAQRERLAALLFGTAASDAFDAKGGSPGIYFLAAPVAALQSVGRQTGVVLDIGDSVTQTAAVCEGFVIGPSLLRAGLGGRDLTEYLLQLLRANPAVAVVGPIEIDSGGRALAKRIKEQSNLFSVALDCELELRRGSTPSQALLPDDAAITLDHERLLVPEALFQPSLMGPAFADASGVHDLLRTALRMTSLHFASLGHSTNTSPQDHAGTIATLWGNVVVVGGGGANFDGFVERLQKELAAVVPREAKTAVVFSPPERAFSSWIGASTITWQDNFQGMWVTNADWRAEGPSVVHRKCF